MKNPAAVALGRLGGQAGTGAAKRRTPAQARAAALARWSKHRSQQQPHHHNKMTTTEKFSIKPDPSNPSNWGIIWENNGTQGGFTSAAAARKSALDQNGSEAGADESAAWEW